MNDKRSIDNLDNLIKTNPMLVSQHDSKQAAHNLAVSKALKEYYQTPEGIKERKLRSERTKKYWASAEGQAKKERLRKKLTKS